MRIEDREILNIFMRLYEFSSIEYQKELWFTILPGYVSGSHELICELFDSWYIEEFSQTKANKWFMPLGQKLLQKLILSTDAFLETSAANLPDEELVESPEWIKLSNQAKEVLRNVREEKKAEVLACLCGGLNYDEVKENYFPAINFQNNHQNFIDLLKTLKSKQYEGKEHNSENKILQKNIGYLIKKELPN